MKIEISGVTAIEAEGEAVVLKASRPDETNSIQEPDKIVPVTEKVDGLGDRLHPRIPALLHHRSGIEDEVTPETGYQMTRVAKRQTGGAVRNDAAGAVTR